MRSILKKIHLPLMLSLVLLLPLFIGPHIPYMAKAALYSISLSMKAVLLFFLPFIIFSFVFSSLLNFKSGVIKFILTLISMVFISNCIAITIGFSVGSLILDKLTFPVHSPNTEFALNSLWNFELPKIISNQYGLITGFLLGIIFSFKRNTKAEWVAKKLNFAANFFLKRIFIPVLPLFILGFVFKLEQDDLLEKALISYGPVFFVVVGTQITYMLLLYFCVARFSLKQFFQYLRNVLPATITGLSTLSSAATMPILILCSEKNIPNPTIPETVIPATINTHTLGSAIGITVLSLSTLLAFGHGMPTFAEFVEFGFFYALAKFAVAAVPGGAIIVATPLLETYFNFTNEMVGLITAIYMLFDPFGTATNVTGNGFFAILISKIYPFDKVPPTTNVNNV